jgi:predicted NACHT family NTPase
MEISILSFALWLGDKIAGKGFDSIMSQLDEKEIIDRYFTRCVEDVSKKLEDQYPDVLGNSVSYFFKQKEVFDELCKLLFVNQTVDLNIIKSSFDVETLPSNFILDFVSELKAALLKEPVFQRFLSNKEIFVAISSAGETIEKISATSDLSLTELQAIKQLLRERLDITKRFDLTKFLILYKQNVINNLSAISFMGLGVDPSIKKGRRKDLNSVFVKPSFDSVDSDNKRRHKSYIERRYYSPKIIEYKDLFQGADRYVILGNPGAGKSVLLKHIICNICNGNTDEFLNKDLVSHIPFRVELKNYHSFKHNGSGGILNYLIHTLVSDYQTPSISEDEITQILTTQKVILFFDGLDEIFKLSDKIETKNDIENFHHHFPNIKSITTSRFIGYEEARLSSDTFCELRILPFGENQMIEYISKWYALEEDDAQNRKSETDDCISKISVIDSDLTSNPLLLSLIVILYRNNLQIPESKLEIYKSCTNTLVDKWEANKDLKIEIPDNIKLKKEALFSDLAFWQYNIESSRQTDVSYEKAKGTIAHSMTTKGIADEFNAENLAELFLDYAQKRSIYFENNFTHKTFLEYYAAFWIYSNIEKKHKINERKKLIDQHIGNPFWFVVLELFFNMIDKDQPDNDILDAIFGEQLARLNTLDFLLYVLPSLKNLSTDITKKTYTVAINYLFGSYKPNKEIFSKFQKTYHLQPKGQLSVRH